MRTAIISDTVKRCQELASQFGDPDARFFTRKSLLSGTAARGLVLDMVIIDAGVKPLPYAAMDDLRMTLLASGGPIYRLTEV